MIVVVDIGNTNIHPGRWEQGNVTPLPRARRFDNASSIVYASVNPKKEREFLAQVRRRPPANILKVGRDLPVPIGNRYRNPRAVGVDRLVNGVAAFERMRGRRRGRPCVVVDVGTAITIDVFSSRREFLGGAIAPGPSTSASALAGMCALLPKISPTPIARAIGRETAENIRAGIHWGVVGFVETMIRRIAGELGKRPRVFATGGGGGRIASLPVIDEFIPTLTLEGIGWCYHFAV